MFRKLMTIITFIGVCIIGDCSAGQMSVKEGMAMTTDYMNKPDDFWKQHLKPEVYHVCRQKGTELAGSGKYDHFYEKGTYYCACCGGDHPVYKSETKFDSGTGWPSFWSPFSPSSVTLKEDTSGLIGWAFPRTEVVCSRCGGHLGHVFDDGPKEHTGKRYCMNSAALSFVPEGQEPKHLLEGETPQENQQS